MYKTFNLKMDSQTLDADQVLKKLGSFGLQQLWTFWLCNIVVIFVGLQLMAPAFIASTPPYKCYASSFGNITNGTGFSENKCTVIKNNSTFQCGQGKTTIVYDEKFGKTIVSDWNLICDREILNELSSSAFFLGYLIGSLIAPIFADYFGRRPTLLVCLVGLSIMGTVVSFSSNYGLFVTFRILTGVFLSGVAVTSWVLACESMVTSLRAYVAIAQGLCWTIGYCMVGVFAYWLPDWKKLASTLGIPCFITITYYWFLSESLHWYIAKNRLKDAEKWILRAAYWNRKNIDIAECYTTRQKEIKRSFTAIFKTPNLLVHLGLMSYIWFGNSFVYYAMSLFTTNLAGDRYLNYILSGVVELPAYVIIAVGALIIGRKKTMFIFNILGAAALIVLPCLPQKTANGTSLQGLIIVFWLLGKFSVTITTMGGWLYSAEIFPTTIRGTTIGICSVWARVAGMIAPFIGKHIDESSLTLASCLFAAASLLSAIVVLFLPETKGKTLPRDIEDIDAGPLRRFFGSQSQREQ